MTLRKIPDLNVRILHQLQESSGVVVEDCASIIIHDAVVELSGLLVFFTRAFGEVVALARHDVVGYFVWSFSSIGLEFIDRVVEEGIVHVSAAAGAGPEWAIY